jgi:ATP-dependent DNA helicase RecG
MNLGYENERVEFKKSTGEMKEAVISMSAILNKHKGGVIYFGVSNIGEILGQQIGSDTTRDISRSVYEHIKPTPDFATEIVADGEKQYIKVIFNGGEQPYSAYGRYYLRVSDEDKEITRAQLRMLFQEDAGNYSAWENAPTEYTADDVNEKVFADAYGVGYKMGRFTEPYSGKVAVLKKLKLIKEGKLTNAGYYLFSDKSPLLVKLALFATDAKLTFLDQNQFKGNIFECIHESMTFVSRHIRWRAEIAGEIRQDIPEIPLDAIREIVINAFAHAKYFATNASHEIDVFPSKVQIFSPGNLPAIVDPAEYAKGSLASELRNPTIADVLFLCGRIERFGTGFWRAFSTCDDVGIKYEYRNTEQGFVFEFKRELITPFVTQNDTNVYLDDSQLAVYELIKKDGRIEIKEIARQIGKSERTVSRMLEQLKKLGFIKREKGKNSGYWKTLK